MRWRFLPVWRSRGVWRLLSDEGPRVEPVAVEPAGGLRDHRLEYFWHQWRSNCAGGDGGTRAAIVSGQPAAKVGALGAILLAGGLFMLAFFTVHFGMFHFVHSVFLYSFFPVTTDGKRRADFQVAHVYWQVVKDYWPFVFVAAVAERQAFKRPGPDLNAQKAPSVTATAIAAAGQRRGGFEMGIT